jgi:hypothetical protein
MRGRKRKPILQVLLLASCMFMPGCDDTPPTDCYEMRTSEGTRADLTACTCTFYYPSGNGSPRGPACYKSCRDTSGVEVHDCSALPPL